MRKLPLVVAVTLTIVGLLSACGGDEDRPTTADWAARWETTRQLVPDPGAFDEDAEERCGELLGEARHQREEMLPAPDDQIAEAFEAWLIEVESFALDCVGDPAARDEQLDEIADLGDQVDLAVAGG